MIRFVRFCLAAALLMQAISIVALVGASLAHGSHRTDRLVVFWGAMILAQLFALHARMAVDR